MIRTAHFAMGLAALGLAVTLGAGSAAAQSVDLIVPPHYDPEGGAVLDEDVQHIEGAAGGVERAPRVMKPGALLLASFDSDSDALISRSEIDAGAAAAFAAADRNKDGSLGGFEQSDWAATVGAADDVLANPMLFDANLDRSVTEAEFTAGLQRLAASLAEPGTGLVTLANLTQPLRPQYEPSERAPGRAPPPGGREPLQPAVTRFGWQ